MAAAGLKTIIALSFVLAVGFLLVILSCALFKVYYPLLVVATFVVAPLPNWICSRCANPDDFVESSGGAAVLDLGHFMTGFFVVMGVGACPDPRPTCTWLTRHPSLQPCPSSSLIPTSSPSRP